MNKDELQIHNLLQRFDSVYSKLKGEIGEFVALEKQLDRKRIRLIRSLVVLKQLFRSKPAGLKLGKFDTFEQCVNHLIFPLMTISRRTAFYSVLVGEHLIGKVTDEELEKLGFEKAKHLATLAKAKGKVPKELVERAYGMTSEEVKEEVKAIVYKGNSDHGFGEWVTIEIEGPRTFIYDIQEYLRLVKRQEGHGPSSAELLSNVLKPLSIELLAEEDRKRKKVAGVAR